MESCIEQVPGRPYLVSVRRLTIFLSLVIAAAGGGGGCGAAAAAADVCWFSLAQPEAVSNILKQCYGDPEQVTDELVECILTPGLESGAVKVRETARPVSKRGRRSALQRPLHKTNRPPPPTQQH